MKNIYNLLFIFFTLLPTITKAEEITILMFGDSLTQGYGLDQNEGLVPTLQEKVRNEAILLINGGVSGDTTAGGASRIEWSLTPEIDAIVIALGGNDMLRGIDPKNTYENLEYIINIVTDKNIPFVLVGMEAPMNYGKEFKRDFDAIFPDLAMKHNGIYAKSFFEPLIKDNIIPLNLMQKDGIHPNKLGVEKIAEYMYPKLLSLKVNILKQNRKNTFD